MERRNYLIEELIKADHTYRPPADYRPAKKHRKVSLRLPCQLRYWPDNDTNAQPAWSSKHIIMAACSLVLSQLTSS